MPRAARVKSSAGLYHIMLLGADGKIIFQDEEDCRRFLDTLGKARAGSSFRLYAYCLMGNHAHLLIKEDTATIEQIFKRIGASYAYYYNWKYETRGHLFQDRFRSEAIEDNDSFLDILHFICQNPVKAGLSRTPFRYPWLGCSGITESDDLLYTSAGMSDKKREELRNFVSSPCRGEHLEDTGARRLSDREAAEQLCRVGNCKDPLKIKKLERKRRDIVIQTANEAGLSIRQLARLTGLSKSTIERILRSDK